MSENDNISYHKDLFTEWKTASSLFNDSPEEPENFKENTLDMRYC